MAVCVYLLAFPVTVPLSTWMKEMAHAKHASFTIGGARRQVYTVLYAGAIGGLNAAITNYVVRHIDREYSGFYFKAFIEALIGIGLFALAVWFYAQRKETIKKADEMLAKSALEYDKLWIERNEEGGTGASHIRELDQLWDKRGIRWNDYAVDHESQASLRDLQRRGRSHSNYPTQP